jgi:predicted permease
MIWFLRGCFTVVLLTMLVVTTWASLHGPVWAVPRDVVTHPWFIATLFDTYFGFLTFFSWVAYKEANWLRSLLWLVLILLLGNIAMATYMLIQLFRVPSDARLEDVLLRK